MIKKIAVLIALLLIMSSCSTSIIEKDSVESIEIVLVGKDTGNCQEINVFSNVDDLDLFLDEFSKLKPDNSVVLGTPKGVAEGSLAVKINYKDENYDIICFDGKARYTKKTDVYHYDSGWDVYNCEEFESFLMSYLNREEFATHLCNYFSDSKNYNTFEGKVKNVDGNLILVEILDTDSLLYNEMIAQNINFKIISNETKTLGKDSVITFTTSFKYRENNHYPIVSLESNGEKILNTETGINLLVQQISEINDDSASGE